ncbi:MAG: lipid A export permease/ATP-binding protein MsbA [Candidatus Polarisedimenticolaceae bacterium]|nr:lipid A export permease/ATP-binding protein MsbA [Candidatus Polarisedimenticolaceae bacterium]
MPETRTMTGRQLYLRLLTHVRPYWRQFSAGILAMVVLAAAEPAIPALLKPILDGSFVEGDPDTIFWTPILLILLFVIRGIMTFCSNVIFQWVSGRLVFDLRQLMFERILTLPTSYFDASSTGNTISVLTYNVSQVTTAATRVLTILVRDSLSLVGLIAYMFYLNWMLACMVFLVMPLIALVVLILGKRLRLLSKAQQNMVGDMTHVLEEGVRGQKMIKVFQSEASESSRFTKMANWIRRYELKIEVAGSAHGPIIETAAALMIATLIYVGTHDTIAGELSVGGFVAFLTALGLLFSPVKRLTGVNRQLQKGIAAAESVFDLIDETPEQDGGREEIRRAKGHLAFNKVSFRYPTADRDALSAVSFNIEPGTTLALVGASGGGKTTIASLVPRFYNPTGGTITLDGIDLQDLSLESLRRNLSYVGQESILFNDTIRANICYGKRNASMEEIRTAAADAHALEFIEQLPEGFDTPIGEEGVRLSGGQRQRLSIARAFLKDAPVLLLDEATSALDNESERHVQAALKRLTEDRTTIVIAHRLSTIEHADRILLIKGGEVIEGGSHNELLAIEGEYHNLYHHQFKPA